MAQSSGSAAEIWYKVETTSGVTPADAAASPADTTLASAANPGDTSIEVASDTNIAAGDILKVGNNNNMEFLKVASGYSSGTTVSLDSDTKVNFRHESGEDVDEVDVTTGWFKLGNVVSFDPQGGRSLQQSAALTGARVVSNSRAGNYSAGVNMTAELGIEAMGIFLVHALNDTYKSVGTSTAGASTTLGAAAAIGDTDITVADGTGLSAGAFLQIESGDNAEVIKIDSSYSSGTTVPLDTTSHPNGIRQAHSNGASVDEVVSPFTHTIKRGSSIPDGLTFLLKYTDTSKVGLFRGNKVSSMDVSWSPDSLPTMTLNLVGKATQVFSEDIFGSSPTSLSHTPYSHTEMDIKVDTSSITSNLFESLSINIQNTINATNVIGSPFLGAITPGEGSSGGSFTSQFEDLTFSDKIVADTETHLEFVMTYIEDSNHSLEFDFPKARFEGVQFPGVASKDPVTTDYTFTGNADTSNDDTDIVVTYKTTEHSPETPA